MKNLQDDDGNWIPNIRGRAFDDIPEEDKIKTSDAYGKTQRQLEMEELAKDQPEGWIDWTSDTITKDIIKQYKRGGTPKPPGVSSAVWSAPEILTERHWAIVNMVVMGQSTQAIAKEIGLSEARINLLVQGPEMKAAIAEKRELYFGDGRSKMQSLVNDAFGVIKEIMMNPDAKDNVRLSAAQYVMDQTIGKAQQTVKVEGNLLGDFMSQLDKAERVVHELEHVAIPRDEMDDKLDQIIGKNFVVGVRSEQTK